MELTSTSKPTENQHMYNVSGLKPRAKLIIAIAFGLLGLLLSSYGINKVFPQSKIDIPISLIFPILSSMVFGWRYGLISAIAGSAFCPFLLWPEDGWTNFLTSLIYASFFTFIGTVNGMDVSKSYRLVYFRILLILIIYFAVTTISYVFLFNPLFELNQYHWNINALRHLNTDLLLSFAIKDCVNFAILTFFSDLLIQIPLIRRIFSLPVTAHMRYNTRIIFVTYLVSILIWVGYVGLGFVLLNHSGFDDGHYILAFWILFSGGSVSARVIIYYTEKQLSTYEKIKESEDSLRLQIEKMPIAYIVWDTDLRVKSWNPAAEKLFGYSANEIIGKSAYETIITESVKNSVSKIWFDLKFKGIEKENTNENITKNGETIICNWTNTPVKDTDGKIYEIVSMVKDITIEKNIENCLQFVALHEWDDSTNNFFSSISNYIGKTLNLDYVLISKVLDDNKTVETLAYYVGGKIISNTQYNLEGTPCENVYGKKMCIYPNNIQSTFPDDIALVKMNAEGYIGQPLWDANEKPIGLIACISKKELKNIELIKPILNIVATRVGSEMARKHTKDLIQISEKNYRLLFENMTSGFALHDMIYDETGKPMDYRYISANPAFEKLTGIPVSNIIGKRVKELLPDLEQYWVDTFGNVALTGKPISYENYQENIGKYFDTWVFSPNKDQFAVIFHDITERKKSQDAIKESEANLNSLINNRADSIWSIDINYNFITINNFFHNAFVEVLNIDIKKGMNALEILSPELLALWKPKYDLALAGQKVVFEFSVQVGEQLQYFENSLNPIITDGLVTGASGFSVNITDRKLAQEDLEKSLSLLKATLESTADGILVVDLNGVILNYNKKFLDIAKIPESIATTTIDEKLLQFVINDLKDPESFLKKVKYLYAHPEEISFDILEFKDGRIIERYSIPQMQNGKSIGRVWSFRDVTSQKMAEYALRESEFFFKETQRAGFIGSYKTDFIKGTWESSDILDKILGIDYNYIKSIQGWLDIVHPADQDMMNNYLNKEVIRNRKPFNKEYRIKRISDGETRWVLGLGVTEFDEKGNILSLIGTIQDINERKRADEALLRSERLNRSILQTALDGFWIVDLKGRFVDINEAFIQIIGYDRQEILSMSVPDIELIDDEKKVIQRIERVIKNGNERFESKHRRKDGSIIDVEVSINFLPEEQLFFVFVNDITDRKLAENAIRESKANMSAIIENTLDSIWAINKSYEIIYINNVFKQAYLASFGIQLEVGMNLLEAIPVFIRPEWKSRYDRAFKNEQFVLEDKIDLGFTVLYIELAVNPIVVDGEVIGASLFSRDITERKNANESLRLSEERFKAVTDSAEEWIWEVDNNGLYTYSNLVVEKILGYKAEEIVGKFHFYDFFKPSDRDTLKENAFDVFAQKLSFKDFENTNLHKNGSEVILKTAASPIQNNTGDLIGYRGADIDITIQKRMEVALLESEEKYRLTFMTSPDAVNINQIDGTYIDVNDGFTRLTGYKRDEVIGVRSTEINIWSIPEDRVKFIKILKEKGFVDNLESVFRCKDGSLKTALMSARIININDAPHILSITRDISERKRMEQALVDSEHRLRKLFDKSNDAIFLIDKKSGKYLDANTSASKATGYSLNDLRDKTTSDITPLESKKRISIISKIKNTVDLGEVEYFRSDGSKRTALLSVIPLSDDKVYGIAHDITERKQYEDTLKILSRAVDQSPASVVITDIKGRIEYVNSKFTSVTGYTTQEAIGLNPSILKSGYTSKEEYKNLWKTILLGREWQGEFCNIKKNGEKYWESALISPITNDKGEIIHFVAVKEDVTEKKEAERKILSSIIDAEERERNRFSRDLHDGLGPLLSTVKLYFQWLSETNDPEKRKVIIEKGDKNLNEAIETIREISNNLSPRTLNSFGVIAAMKNFIDNLNQTQKLSISFKSNTENRFEKNVEIIVYRIVTELLNNTLKYAKATKSEVILALDEKNDVLTLSYSDNGKGFDVSNVQSSGKGLGLFNITQRVNTLDGKISISSSEGKGIHVSIELPLNKK